MEFWGVEVKPGEQLKLQPEPGKLIHLSHAALGEVKDVKGAKHVPLRMKIDAKSFTFGVLSADTTQLMFDLAFEREFELSHDWKNGSVFFVGYTFHELDSDDIKPKVVLAEDVKNNAAVASAAKAVGKKEEADVSDEDESESVSDDDDMDSDDHSDGSFSSEDELPKAIQLNKKRPAEPAQTALVARRTKLANPVKTGITNDHKAAPLPSKPAGKSPFNQKSPKNQKSGGPKAHK